MLGGRKEEGGEGRGAQVREQGGKDVKQWSARVKQRWRLLERKRFVSCCYFEIIAFKKNEEKLNHGSAQSTTATLSKV